MQYIIFFVRKYWKEGIMLILGIVIIILAYVHFFHDKNEITDNLINEIAIAEPDKEGVNKEAIKDLVEKVHIDIKGAVKKPGVYEIKKDAMVTEAITLAGGFNKNAYQNGINLSKKVKDEMVIYVYTTEEIKKPDPEKETVCKAPTYNICKCVEEKESIILPSDTDSKNEDNKTEISDNETKKSININTASSSELQSLTGIGEAKAKEIIKYREENNGFKAIEELKNISGIGDKVFEKIKDYITV